MNKSAKPVKKKGGTKNEYWAFPALHDALEIGLYYGFTPESALHSDSQRQECAISFEEKSTLIKKYFAQNNAAIPIAVAYECKEKRNTSKVEIGFDIIGNTRAICDATLIKTLFEIVRAEGNENPVVEINSVGDRESFARFMRDFTAYIRKNSAELDPECRQAVKKNPLVLYTCTHEKCATIKEKMPFPMNYLSEPSRVYFMEVLELLETTGIPYTITNTLIDNHDYATHTIFRIKELSPENKSQKVVAYGARWTGIAKKMGFKKDIPGISGIVTLEKQKVKAKKIAKPRFYFVQMGQEAKLKSLTVIEALRQAKIPVYHSLSKDKLVAQLSTAEHLKVPYVLIMGQKESLENTLLIRELNYRSQETVKISQVTDYLKKLLHSLI